MYQCGNHVSCLTATACRIGDSLRASALLSCTTSIAERYHFFMVKEGFFITKDMGKMKVLKEK